MSVGCAVFLLGAFVRVGRLRSRRGLSAIRGFVELRLSSLHDCVRDANVLGGLTWGECLEFEPGGVGVSDLSGW